VSKGDTRRPCDRERYEEGYTRTFRPPCDCTRDGDPCEECQHEDDEDRRQWEQKEVTK